MVVLYVDHFGSRALGTCSHPQLFPHPAHPGKRGRASHKAHHQARTTSNAAACLGISHVPRLLTSAAQAEGGTEGHTFLGAPRAPRIVANLWRCSAHAEATKKHLPPGGVLRDFLDREVHDGHLCRAGPVNNGEVQRLLGDVPTTSHRPRGPFHPVSTGGGQGGWGTRS
jgi:hypothetical protein